MTTRDVSSSCSCASGVALEAAQQRIQELEAEPTLRQLAVHLGWGNGGMSAEDAFRFLAERERLLRLVQAALDTHKSDAPTAESALLDRISVIRGRAEAAEARLSTLQNTIRELNDDREFSRQGREALEARLSTVTQRLQQLEAVLRAVTEHHEGYGMGMGQCMCPGHIDARALLTEGVTPKEEDQSRVDEGQPRRIGPTGSTADRNEPVPALPAHGFGGHAVPGGDC